MTWNTASQSRTHTRGTAIIWQCHMYGQLIGQCLWLLLVLSESWKPICSTFRFNLLLSFINIVMPSHSIFVVDWALAYHCMHGTARAYLVDSLRPTSEVVAPRRLRYFDSPTPLVLSTRWATLGDRAHGTVCQHRPGPPPLWQHSGVKPRPTFSVSHSAVQIIVQIMCTEQMTSDIICAYAYNNKLCHRLQLLSQLMKSQKDELT